MSAIEIGPNSLQREVLEKLGNTRSVEFFRRFLWAESDRGGVGKRVILVPRCINVGDGGIDAYVEDDTPSDDEVIPMETTRFETE